MVPNIVFGVVFLGILAAFLITAKINSYHRRQALGGALLIVPFGLLFVNLVFPEVFEKLSPRLSPKMVNNLVAGIPMIWGGIILARKHLPGEPWRPAILHNPILICGFLITSIVYLYNQEVLRDDLFIYACSIAMSAQSLLLVATIFWHKKIPEYPNLYKKILNQPDSVRQTAVKYPPAVGGIEVKSLEEILSGHRELLHNIDLTTETGGVFEKRYWPAIERYAGLVHLLPASENDHHRDAGGLLHHGLEVGYYTMALARAGMYGREYGLRKREGRERWLFACFMAGLCHDLGKVVNDVRVSADGGLVWSPDAVKLTKWAAKNQVKKYYVDWQPNRHKVHENLTLGMLGRVLTDDDRQYISEMDTQLSKQVMLALAPASSADAAPSVRPYNIRGMIQDADSRSVKEDKKKSRTPADLGLERATPMVRHYHDGMQRLFQARKWRINEPGAAAWVIGPAKDLYLIWPRCGLELYESLQDEGVKGVPASPEVIADTMAGNDLLVAAPEGGFYWRIKPEDMEGAPLTALRINPKFAPNFLNLLPAGLNGSMQADEEMASWSSVSTDDKAGSAPASPSGQVIQLHPASPEMHDASGPGPGKAVMPPQMGSSLPPAGYVQQPTEVEKPVGKGGWSAAQILLIGISIGVLGVLGVLTYYGKHWYGDELSFWWYFWASWKTVFERTHLHWTAFVTVVVLIVMWIYPKWKYKLDEGKEQIAEIRKNAQEFMDGAKQEAIDIRAAAGREGGEIKKAAKDEAAETRIKAKIKAKEEAVEVREQAAQDAEAIRKQAEEDGAKVLQDAERDAIGKIDHANKQMNALWFSLESKAIKEGVPPEKLSVILKVKLKAEKDGEELLARVEIQAKEAAEDIIAEARAQAQAEAAEIITQAHTQAKKDTEEHLRKVQIQVADILDEARAQAAVIKQGQVQGTQEAGEITAQAQEQAQDEHVHDQPVQDDMVEAGTSPEGDMDDQGQNIQAQAELIEQQEQATIQDVLSDRQARVLEYILEHGSMTIQEFESLYPDVNRRTLQRDLKIMVDKRLLLTEGATHQMIYQIKGKIKVCDTDPKVCDILKSY